MYIETLDLKLNPPPIKWLVAFNHDWMITTIESLGGEQYLESSKIFAICFDTTPLNNLENMKNYGDVVIKFPNSMRVCGKSFYIGNYNKEDWLNIVGQCLEYWSANILAGEVKGKYEIVHMKGGFTK